MKVNRTFSIDLWIVKELKDKRNQSQFVCDAIKTKLDGSSGSLGVADAPTRQLMAALMARDDCEPFVKRVLLQVLTRGS